MKGNQISFYSQEKMGDDVLPKTKETKKTYRTYKEFFEDSEVEEQRKVNVIAEIIRFETLNGLTKQELHSALKWLFYENYEFVPAEKHPGFKLIKGDKEEV